MAREWKIYDKSGTTVKATVKKLEYSGQYMADRYLSVTVNSPYPINFEIGDKITYRGDEFVLNYIPAVKRQSRSGATGVAIVYDNIKFKSSIYELENCLFTDYVQDDNQVHYTGLSAFSFYVSKLDDFANRVRACLNNKYGKNVWTVVCNNETVIKKEQSFSVNASTSVWNALAQFNNIFKINFTVRGRTIYIGEPQAVTAHSFFYGIGNGLRSLTQTVNTDQQIVTKLRAYGSERNIPYRFYNNYYKKKYPELFDQTLHPEMFKAGRCILESMYMPRLMLPYSVWSTHPWDAYILSDNTTKYGERDGEKIFDGSDEDWEEIYPTLSDMTTTELSALDGYEGSDTYNNLGELDRILVGSSIADNGVSADGRYESGAKDTDGVNIVTSFKVTIPNIGFNPWRQRIDGETPILELTSGLCTSDHGRFEILNCEPKENIRNGYELTLQRVLDSNINMYYPNSTFMVSPGDHFVLTGIEMPDIYVEAAEQRLLSVAQEWLSDNDHEKYTYQPVIDNIFMARHPEVSDYITEGMKFLFSDVELGIQEAAVTISQLVIKEDGDSDDAVIIPKYDITLNDDVEATLMDKVDAKIHAANGDFTASFESLARQIKDKLSKVDDDAAAGFINFLKGLYIGDSFMSGLLGEGGVFRKDADGKIYLETDKLYVRMKAYFDSIEIRDFKHSGGNRIASKAGIKCARVEWLDVDGKVLEQTADNLSSVERFRCYFRASDGTDRVPNDFMSAANGSADLAFCDKTTLEQGINKRRYWRAVVGRNGMLTDADEFGWIDLSATDCEAGSDIPMAEDDIIQLGNRTDTERQGAIIEYVGGENAPSYQIYQGIDSYDLTDKCYINIGYDSQTGRASMDVHGDFFFGDKDGSTYVRYNQATKKLEIKAELDVDSTFDGKTLDEKLTEEINSIDTEKNNFLRNSGFTGEYESEHYGSDSDVGDNTVVYSNPFDHWEHKNVDVVDCQDSASLRAVEMNGGTLRQTLDYTLIAGKDYIFSLRGRQTAAGGSFTVSVGGYTEHVELTNTIEKYNIRFTCTESSDIFELRGTGLLMELQLTMGTLSMGWTPSHLDEDRSMTYYHQLAYLANALVESRTQILGGLILSQIIKVGNYRDKIMTEETGGMSGIFTDTHSPFLWGGGTLEKAIYTIAKYKDNPTYQPTDDELAAMANVVVTHGGRAILNDVILRGYVYARGGEFSGTVHSRLVYSDIKIIDDATVITPDTEPYSFYWIILSRGDVCRITLPDPTLYEGLEMSFLQPPHGVTRLSLGGTAILVVHDPSDGGPKIMSVAGERSVLAKSTYQWVTLETIEGTEYEIPEGYIITVKAIDGNWEIISHVREKGGGLCVSKSMFYYDSTIPSKLNADEFPKKNIFQFLVNSNRSIELPNEAEVAQAFGWPQNGLPSDFVYRFTITVNHASTKNLTILDIGGTSGTKANYTLSRGQSAEFLCSMFNGFYYQMVSYCN